MTLWTMQSIAHGADYVGLFQMGEPVPWERKFTGMAFWIIQAGKTAEFREVREIHKKVESLKEAAGSLYEAKVGVLKDYDNVWDAEVDAWHRRVEEVSQKGIFAAAQKSHTPMDYLYLNDETKAEELKKVSGAVLSPSNNDECSKSRNSERRIRSRAEHW